MDTVLHAEAVARDDTDVSFSLEFRKARERTPVTRADFQTVRVALVADRWEHQAKESQQRQGKVSPKGLKFLDALNNVLASEGTSKVRGRAAASTEAWKAECFLLDLIDPEKAASARTLFNKYRLELVAANRVGCEGDLTWTL